MAIKALARIREHAVLDTDGAEQLISGIFAKHGLRAKGKKDRLNKDTLTWTFHVAKEKISVTVMLDPANPKKLLVIADWDLAHLLFDTTQNGFAAKTSKDTLKGLDADIKALDGAFKLITDVKNTMAAVYGALKEIESQVGA